MKGRWTGSFEGNLLRHCVKLQLGNLAAVRFSLKSPSCDLLKTYLTLTLMTSVIPPCATHKTVVQGAFKVSYS